MKKLLAIDTSTEIASLALRLDDEVVSVHQDSQKKHAQFLLPLIDKLLADAQISLGQLDAIIFGCGPGSFTGLRIACSIAKGLAYAQDLGLIPVSSLAAIAWAARVLHQDKPMPVLSVLDARMRELYWAYFDAEENTSKEYVSPAQVIDLKRNQELLIAGVGLDEYWENIPEQIKSHCKAKYTVYPDAAAMIQLAQETQMPKISAAQAQPIYIRNQVTQGGVGG